MPSAAAAGAVAPVADSPPPVAVDARAALAWTHSARFFDTAARLDHLPGGELPEIAFVGRSNAGKSTAINRLAQQKRLAFASRTPGRTQHINLFAVGPKDTPDALFADLPGYGYAAVERSAKLRWQEVMSQYLQLRRPLHGVVMMVDARLGFTELDQRLLALLAPRVVCGEVRLLVLLTKADKLNRREAQASLAAAQPVLAAISGEASDIGVTLFSALSRQGLDDVAQTLHGWVRPGVQAGAQAEGVGAEAVAGAPSVPGPGVDGIPDDDTPGEIDGDGDTAGGAAGSAAEAEPGNRRPSAPAHPDRPANLDGDEPAR